MRVSRPSDLRTAAGRLGASGAGESLDLPLCAQVADPVGEVRALRSNAALAPTGSPSRDECLADDAMDLGEDLEGRLVFGCGRLHDVLGGPRKIPQVDRGPRRGGD